VIKNLPVGFEIQYTGTWGVYGLEADVITERNTISRGSIVFSKNIVSTIHFINLLRSSNAFISEEHITQT
jgi:hypothetical protein